MPPRPPAVTKVHRAIVITTVTTITLRHIGTKIGTKVVMVIGTKIVIARKIAIIEALITIENGATMSAFSAK